MTDSTFNQESFEPLSKEALQEKVTTLVNQLRTTDNEEYIKTVGELHFDEDIVMYYLELKQSGRDVEFPRMLNSTPDIEAFEKSQIKFLIMLSLSDEELVRIQKTFSEIRAREEGFKSHTERLEIVEKLLIRFLELCKHHYYATFWEIQWDKIMPHTFFAHIEEDGNFTEKTMQILEMIC